MMYKMLCVYFIAIFWGCNPKTKSNDQIKQVKDYYNNGILKNVSYYKNDSIIKKIKYYQTGQIENFKLFKNNLLNDSFCAYFENGNIKASGFYKNGLRDGSFRYYYENGKLEYYQFYFSDTMIYEKKYDFESNMIFQEGFPFRISIGLVKQEKDSAFILVYSAVPPSTNLYLKFSELVKNVKSEILYYNGASYPIMYYFKTNKGKHLFEVNVEMIDSFSGISRTFKQQVETSF